MPAQPEQMSIVRRDAHDIFSVYCNSTQIAISPWDIRIFLDEMMGTIGDGLDVVRHGSVAMSPAHGKAFLGALQLAVQQFEAQFGEIDLSHLPQPTLNSGA